jgi:diguanylate cyclase
MAKLLESLEQAGADTSAYGQTLSGVSGELAKTEAGETGPIKSLVTKLLKDTERMQARSRQLEARVQESSEEIRCLRDRLETARTQSLTDQLTGIANRKAFDERLSASAADAVEQNAAMSLILCDIDHFKAFNDTFGHQTGDQVLKLVARALRENVKGRDMPARYGGEEFAIVLPHTNLQAAKTVAEQIRFSVQSKRLVKKSTNENLGSITLSLGCAEWRPGEALADLVHRADACLYAAKRTGRNRVMAEDEVDPSAILDGRPAKPQPQVHRAMAVAG